MFNIDVKEIGREMAFGKFKKDFKKKYGREPDEEEQAKGRKMVDATFRVIDRHTKGKFGMLRAAKLNPNKLAKEIQEELEKEGVADLL